MGRKTLEVALGLAIAFLLFAIAYGAYLIHFIF